MSKMRRHLVRNHEMTIFRNDLENGSFFVRNFDPLGSFSRHDREKMGHF
jgi:hypothetical protein